MNRSPEVLRLLVATVLVVGTLIGGAIFIEWNPVYSARIPAAGWWRALPMALALGGFAILSAFRHRVGRPFALEALALLLLEAVGGSAVAHPSPHPFFWGAIVPYLVAVLTLMLAQAIVLPWSRWRGIFAASAIILLVSVLLDALGLWPGSALRRPGGLLHNRNYAGEYLALCLPICIVALDGRRRWLVALLVLGLAWTRCRTAWLAAGAGALGTWIFATKERRGALVRSLVWGVAGALLAGLVPSRLHWAEASPHAASLTRLVNLASGSGEMRMRQHWEMLTSMRASDNWLGLGPGNWQQQMTQRAPPLAINRNPHSDYLRALADGGPLALASLMGLYGLGMAVAWRLRASGPEAAGMIVALAVVSLADSMLYRIEATVLVFSALGTISATAPASLTSERVGPTGLVVATPPTQIA